MKNNQISLDDEAITDIERDKLHREIYRTQGKLASRYELDPLGRLKKQIATLNNLTEGGKGKTKVAAGYGQTAVKRSYGYDCTGNLIHRELADGEVQNYFYDLHDQLVKAEIFKKDGTKETWAYSYDLGQKDRKRSSENQSGSFRRPRKLNPLRLGRQPPLAGSPLGRQVYLYLYRPRFLRAFSTSPRLDNRRRRKPTANPLFPLRPNRHPKRNDRQGRQFTVVRQLHWLGSPERGNHGNG